jgi:hypothetical protein
MLMNLGKRSNDLDSWTNLLFIVVMAVVWLIGGIAKTVRKSQTDREQSGQKPVKSGNDGRRDHPSPILRDSSDRQRQVATDNSSSPDRSLQPIAKRQSTPAPILSSESEQFTPAIPLESMIHSVPVPDSIFGPSELKVPIDQSSPGLSLSNLPLDTLQAAILYSEILGKPLSLRISSDEMLLN